MEVGCVNNLFDEFPQAPVLPEWQNMNFGQESPDFTGLATLGTALKKRMGKNPSEQMADMGTSGKMTAGMQDKSF